MTFYFQQISADILALFMQFYLLYFLDRNHILSVWFTRQYQLTIRFILTATLLEICIAYFDCFPSAMFQLPYLVFNAVSYTCIPYIPLLMAGLFKSYSFKRFMILSIPAHISAVLSISSIWNGCLFYVDQYGIYKRGPLHFLFVAICIGAIGLLIYYNYIGSKTYELPEKLSLIILYGTAIFSVIIRIFLPYLLLSWGCITLSLLLYFIFLRELNFRYDPTTKILNRASFDERLESLQNAPPVYIVVLDVNDLKQVNDHLGHVTGDDYLYDTAIIISESFKPIGTAFRIGGDEFSVLCPNCTKAALLHSLKELDRKSSQVAQKYPTPYYIARGFSLYDFESRSIHEVFKTADKKMYQDKAKSKVNLSTKKK